MQEKNGGHRDPGPEGKMFSYALGSAVFSLLKEGFREDAHLWHWDWAKVDDDALEVMLMDDGDRETIDAMLEHRREPLVELLGEVLKARRRETMKETAR